MSEEDEEECETCDTMIDEVKNVDVNDAFEYLMDEKKVLMNFDQVEKELQEDMDKNPVDCMLDNVYIQINDGCLLEASAKVFEIFKNNKDKFVDNGMPDINQIYITLVKTLSKTYTQCSPNFREKVAEYVDHKDEATQSN